MEKTFTFEGEEFQYPVSYCNATEAERREYRQAIIDPYLQRKMETQLKNLPFKEKARRYAKNAGLELLASLLEVPFFPFRLGGLIVTFDRIREKKETTYLSFVESNTK